MPRYRRSTSGPEAQTIHDRVETVLGREIDGVVVDDDGLQQLVLPDGDQLADQKQSQLEQEFGLSLAQRDRSVTEHDGEVLHDPED